jgi:hypothetical protein
LFTTVINLTIHIREFNVFNGTYGGGVGLFFVFCVVVSLSTHIFFYLFLQKQQEVNNGSIENEYICSNLQYREFNYSCSGKGKYCS